MTSLPIQLPDGFSPIIKKGDTVKAGDTIAQKIPLSETVIDVPSVTDIPQHQVEKYLRKNPGEEIKKGDILLERKSLIGRMRIYSQVQGKIVRFERDTGKLVISKDIKPVSDETVERFASPLEGTVSLCDNGKIVIDTDKAFVVGIKGSGGRVQGELIVVDGQTADHPITPSQLDVRVIDKIILCESIAREPLLKAIGMGAAGVIATEIADADFADIHGKNIDTPLIMIEKDDFKKLLKYTGKKIFIDGEAQSVVLLAL